MSDEVKPVFRDDTKRLVESMVRGAVLAMEVEAKHLAPCRSCITCSKFQEREEVCLHYAARPPARVIAYGCVSYHDIEDIPF